jgi:hypothetical protein
LQERGHDRGGTGVGNDVADRRRTQQDPLPPGFAAHPCRGLVGSNDRAGAHLRGDRVCSGDQRRLGAGEDIGNGALADIQAEHLAHQPGKPLEADRLRDVQMQDQRLDAGAEWRAGFEAFGGGCRDRLAATRADAAMAVDAGDNRADRRQVDVVVGVDVGHVGCAECMVAMRAGGERRLDDAVRVLGEGARHAGATAAGILFAAIRQVRFLALRGREAGVVRRLGRVVELSFQFGDACDQGADLLRLRLDQGDQIITGKGVKGCAVHACS